MTGDNQAAAEEGRDKADWLCGVFATEVVVQQVVEGGES
jgi:hypothetical protein